MNNNGWAIACSAQWGMVNQRQRGTPQMRLHSEFPVYVEPLQCGSRKTGSYTAFMVYCANGFPHTGPLATREEAETLAARLNAKAEGHGPSPSSR
jgi:hypothetical protein